MTQRKNQNMLYTYMQITYMVMHIILLLLYYYIMHIIDFDSNKYSSDSSKCCVSEVDLECPKELRKLHNDYPLAPAKIEI